MQTNKLTEYRRYQADPARAAMEDVQRMRDEIDRSFEDFKVATLRNMRNILTTDPKFVATLVTEVELAVAKIAKGDDGKTPVKGTDYFTSQELREIISYVQSRVKPAQDGAPGSPGKPGAPGQHGKTPRAGIDYPTKAQVERMVSQGLMQLLALKPKGEVSKTDLNSLASQIKDNFDFKKRAGEIARALETLQGNEQLDYLKLKNRPGIKMYGEDKAIHRGGGGVTPLYYDLSSYTDGTTKIFSIPANQRVIWVGGSDAPSGQYRQTVDFTVVGSVLTLTSEVVAPSLGATLHLIYVPAA